jgi:hypothetical protein
MGNAKTAAGKDKQVHKKHFCPECDGFMKPVMFYPGKKIKFQCDKGHVCEKKKTIRRY